MKRLVVFVGIVALLVLAGSASAEPYHSGWITRGTDDADCIWYRGQAACTGWNYWHWNRIDRWGIYYGTLLLGFENNERIRGDWNYPDEDTQTAAPFYYNMGGYLKAHATWWSGSGVQATVDARY